MAIKYRCFFLEHESDGDNHVDVVAKSHEHAAEQFAEHAWNAFNMKEYGKLWENERSIVVTCIDKSLPAHSRTRTIFNMNVKEKFVPEIAGLAG